MHHFGGKAEFSGFGGSKAVKKAIEEFKPDVLISAHIHEAGGLEEKKGKTRIINVSRKSKVFEV
jgi:Icc-related predicted phosphoesterase